MSVEQRKPSPTSRLPSTGGPLPAFTLQSADGKTFRHSQYRGRTNLALVFLPERPGPADHAYLQEVATLVSELEEVDSRVLVVTPLPATEALALAGRTDLRVPFLLDPERNVYNAYGLIAEGGARAGVFVADRYLQLYAAESGPDLSRTLSPTKVLEWLRYIDFQCPECSDVTSWEVH